MTAKLESDVVALVRKLIKEKQIFSISLLDPDSPEVKKIMAPGFRFTDDCTDCDDDCATHIIVAGVCCCTQRKKPGQ
jgi:hypothetical protein